MNILFASGYYGAMPIANNVVATRLAAAFTQRGHRCFIMGLSPECVGTEVLPDGTNLIRVAPAAFLEQPLTKYHRFQQQNPTKTAKDFALRHPIAGGLIGLLNMRCFNSPKAIAHFSKKAEQLIAKEHIDAVITICFPFDVAHHLLHHLKAPLLKLYYQLDPHGLHVYYSGEERAARIRLECEAMAAADLVFTTNELYPLYQKDENYTPYRDKCKPIGFPGVFPPKEGDKAAAGFSPDETNIVFCGNLDHRMRDPRCMLTQIEQIIKAMPTTHFYFAGNHEGGQIVELATQYPNQFTLLGAVPSARADLLTDSADILLNIGNVANNMVPSKIFTYFASGKPILNFQKISDCPNAKYFAKYPLAFTHCEWETQDKTAELCDFITKNQNTRLPYTTVETAFQDFTLAGVSDQMLAEMAAKQADLDK